MIETPYTHPFPTRSPVHGSKLEHRRPRLPVRTPTTTPAQQDSSRAQTNAGVSYDSRNPALPEAEVEALSWRRACSASVLRAWSAGRPPRRCQTGVDSAPCRGVMAAVGPPYSVNRLQAQSPPLAAGSCSRCRGSARDLNRDGSPREAPSPTSLESDDRRGRRRACSAGDTERGG